jgi:hypothetical protein
MKQSREARKQGYGPFGLPPCFGDPFNFHEVLVIELEAFVRQFSFIMLTFIMATLMLSACSPSSSDAPAQAVESYLTALVEKDADRLATLSCGEWEDDALLELDSFQAVTARLEGMACEQTGTDGDTVLVINGKIIATYGNEDQELDLSVRTYQVIQEGGEWLVCGVR